MKSGVPTAETFEPAATPGDFDAFAGLVREYVQWCRDRYREHEWFIDAVFGHQALASELDVLAHAYGPPRGRTVLARRDGAIVGGGAYRRIGDDVCEMKRLFVPDRFRGHGTGRHLCDALIASARNDGYRLMRLDTGKLMTEAIELYEALGFVRCAPYHAYPERLMPYLVFMELPLTAG